MNILLVNKFFYICGGVDRYFFELSKLLKRYGHNVAFFSMHHDNNLFSKWNKYFISNVSFENNRLTERIRFFGRMIYSFEAKKKISALLSHFKPDIVHLHSIYHHLSPSIISEISKRNISIVQSLGDYHLISPNYNLFHNNSICEITKPNNYYKAILHKCVKDSYLYSIAEIIEKYCHQFLDLEKKNIKFFLARSHFMRNKLIEYGIYSKKIIYLPHFINSKNYIPNYNKGDYIQYFGRLSPEKGIELLLETMKSLPQIKLKIVGRGNIDYVSKLKLKSSRLKNIEFIGFQDRVKLKKLISGSRFTILPSLWYEVFGLSILESFASGKPVIASNIGGIPETVKDGYNGFLFEPGNVEDCRERILKLWNNPQLCRQMGKNAREYVDKYFSPEEHYEKLMTIYKKAIAKHK